MGGFHLFLNGKIKITVLHAIVSKVFSVAFIYSTERYDLILLILLPSLTA